jgi:hypothetical protein
MRFRRLLIAPLLPVLGGCDPACENEISRDLTSPDGSHRVVLFSRNCGATTGFNTQSTILRRDEHLLDEGGDAFVLDGQDSARVSWTQGGRLSVEIADDVAIFKKENSVRGIEIDYSR